MSSTRTAAGVTSPVAPATLRGPLRQLAEQLWQTDLDSGRVRLGTGPSRGSGWIDVERYVVVPSLARADLLLPAAPRAALRGSVTNYRGLRQRHAAAQRTALGALLAAGAPLPFPRLVVQASDPVAAASLPLATVTRALGADRLHASIRVRTGANRKATLQLVDDRGAPRGFAKLAWNPASAEGIQREADALRDGPIAGPARVPAVLAVGHIGGRRFVVTAPLPQRSVAIRAGVAPPTALEMAALLPLARRDRIAGTDQFRRLQARVATARRTATNRAALAITQEVLGQLAAATPEVPVARRYHGDFTPWNCARDETGTLWCWDWESSELDAVAGMDAVYWHSAVRREAHQRLGRRMFRQLLEDAAPMLTAYGMPRCDHPLVVALVAATLTERSCSLRAHSETWASGWVLPDELVELMTSAREVLADRAGTENDR